MNIVREYVLQWKSLNKNIRLFLLFDLCNQFSIAIYTLYFPRYLISLGYQEDLYGSLMGSATAMMAIFAILAGIVSDRIGRRNSLIVGVGVSKVTYLIRAFLVTIPFLFGAHVIHGVFIALYNASTMPFIFENSTPENRIHAFSMRGMIMRLSTILGNMLGGLLPLLILAVVPDLGEIAIYRLIFTISILVAAFGMWCLYQMQPLAKEDQNQRQHRARPSILQEIKTLPKETLIFVGQFALVRGTISFGAGMFLPFMNTFFLRKFSAGPEITGLIFSCADFAVILGIALAPVLAEKWGMTKAIVITRVITFPMFIIMAFVPNLYVVAAAYLLRNTFQQMSGPLQDSFIMAGLDKKTRATANGVLSAAGNGMRAIALFVAGFVIVKFDYSYLFIIALVFYVLSAACFYAFFARKPKEVAVQ